MRTRLLWISMVLLLVGCTSSQPAKYYNQLGPWNGPFGTRQGLTYEQLLKYGSMKVLDVDKQRYLSDNVPDNYGISFSKIVYNINSIEGLCAISLTDGTSEQAALIKQKLEDHFGKPSIDKPAFTSWDANRVPGQKLPSIIIKGNEVKVFYSNADRCHLL